jgi:hypothetical protein
LTGKQTFAPWSSVLGIFLVPEEEFTTALSGFGSFAFLGSTSRRPAATVGCSAAG